MKFDKYYFLICLSLTSLILVNSELRFVYNVFRNGVTSPDQDKLNGLNEDIFGERWDSPNELTPSGMRMNYLLGRRYSIKYKNFLSSTFNPKEVKIISLSYNHTLSSAASLLQGLYPQGTGPNLSGYQRNVAYPPQAKAGYGNFNQETFGAPALPYNTQVFPISTFSKLDYQYFYAYDIKSNCVPLYYELVDKKNNNSTQSILNEFSNKYGSKLKVALALNDMRILGDFNYVNDIMKNFMSGYIEGKLLKRLTDANISLEDFNNTATNILNYDLYNIKNEDSGLLANITFSTFAQALMQYMDLRISLDQQGIDYDSFVDSPKIVLNSVKGDQIASILKYLQTNINTKLYYVPYGSSLNFELYRPDGKENNGLTEFDYFVNIVFNDIPLKTIAYAEFRKHLNNSWSATLVRWKCSLTPFQFWGFRNSVITLGVLLFVCGITLIVFFICCMCQNPKHELNEGEVNKVEV